MEDRTTDQYRYPPPDTESDSEPNHREALPVERAILLGIAFAAVSSLAYVPLYSSIGAAQILGTMLGIVAGIGCLLVSWRMARRDKLEESGRWTLLAIFVTFGTGELMWADAVIPQTASAIILIALSAFLFRPRRWFTWVVTASLYLAFTLLVERVVFWERFEIMAEAPLTQATPFPLALLLLLLIIRALWKSSIRNRLFVAVTLTTLLLTPALVVFSGLRTRQSWAEQVTAQLESVATLKEAEIESWANTLLTNLLTSLSGSDVAGYIRTLSSGVSPTEDEYQQAYSIINSRLQLAIEQTGLFTELFLLDPNGNVLIATDSTREGDNYAGETYFQTGLTGPHIDPPSYIPTLARTPSMDQITMMVIRPVTNDRGTTIALLAGRADFSALNRTLLERAGLGETGETYLVGANHALLTQTRFEVQDPFVRTEATDTAIEHHVDGSGLYRGYRDSDVVGVFRWLPEFEMVLVAEQEQAEAFAPLRNIWIANAALAAVLIVASMLLALLVIRSITKPIANMVEAATKIAGGDLEHSTYIEGVDEVATLAQSFDVMTSRMRDLVNSLERRVSERTEELERRSLYLEASAEVGHAAASILDSDRLIRQVVELIRERFGLYYVGLFMVDETAEWAVLRAGTGEAGRAMLARNHRLAIGEGSMIGWSVANRQSRIAQEVGEDAVRRATPELPATRSEAALPLQSRGEILGALSVQSTESGAFDEETISLLQTMADQVAVALHNARLFTDSQMALETTRRIYGELSRTAWAEMLRVRTDLAFRSYEHGITPAEDGLHTEAEQALETGEIVVGIGKSSDAPGYLVAVPVKVRGEAIGVLDTYKPLDDGPWTQGEISMLEALSEQLGLALESARLYEEAQHRATRERITREITDKMRRATAVEDIIQSAVDDIFDTLEVSRAFVRLGISSDPNQNNGGDSDN